MPSALRPKDGTSPPAAAVDQCWGEEHDGSDDRALAGVVAVQSSVTLTALTVIQAVALNVVRLRFSNNLVPIIYSIVLFAVMSRNVLWPAVLVAILSLGLAACSASTPGHPAAAPTAKGSPTPTPAVTTPLPVGSQTTSGPDATASVAADWTAFFDPTTPIAQRIKLLQDGAKFKSYLKVQAQPGVAHLTTEQVTDVSVIGTYATVTFNILVDGHTASALTGQSGQANFVAGTWQVSDSAFCALITLENKGKSVPGCS